MNKTTGIICACMNREKMLLVSLQSWLVNPLVNEIIITDWSSRNDISYLSKWDNRIKIIRINNKEYFHFSAALNLALKESKMDLIMKMDTDYILNPYYNLISDIKFHENEFLVGDGWDYSGSNINADDRFIKPTNGFIYTSRKNLTSINGWNEDLEGWGYEDDDLQNRLVKNGLNPKILLLSKREFLYHNPHENNLRIANYKIKDGNQSWARNKKISNSYVDFFNL